MNGETLTKAIASIVAIMACIFLAGWIGFTFFDGVFGAITCGVGAVYITMVALNTYREAPIFDIFRRRK